jgi:uncharacterized protein (TIGR02145 family)
MKTLKYFWVVIFLIMSSVFVSCKKPDNSTKPLVKTWDPLFISSTVGTIGFSVQSDGGSKILDCGIYVSELINPETSGTKLQIGADTGVFVIQLSGLSPNTEFYMKGYAKNAKGEGLGDQVTFTTPNTVADFDNNVYETVSIGTQVWMAKNLRTTHFLNGDLIATTTTPTLDISAEPAPKYQWSYSGDDANALTYGKLYTYYTITDTRNVCPAGWHIPTDAQWITLENFLGGFSVAASSLKESGNTHWTTYNTDATDISLYKALPGGNRNSTGAYSFLNNNGYWWSSTEADASNAWVRSMTVQSTADTRSGFLKKNGASVRCLKD